MKILEQIKSFAFKVVNKLLDFAIPSRKRRQAKKASEEHSIKNKKRRTKRRASFANPQESDFSKNFSHLPKRQRKIRKIPLISKLINHDGSGSLQDMNSQKSVLKQLEKNSNQLIGVATGMQIQDGHLFTDNNGLQISGIESRGNKNDPLNYSVQSDPQILKFILGDQPKFKQKNMRNQTYEIKQENLVPLKQWWVYLVQASDSSVNSISKKDCLPVEDCKQSKNNQSNYSYSKLKIKKTRSQPENVQSQKSNKLKVIQIIDLATDEEMPKLFHIPLVKNLKI